MTSAVIEELPQMQEFSFDYDWGEVVQPYIDGCDNNPVWGVECPGCDSSWAYSCALHHDMTFTAGKYWQCLECNGEWESEQLKWFQLP